MQAPHIYTPRSVSPAIKDFLYYLQLVNEDKQVMYHEVNSISNAEINTPPAISQYHITMVQLNHGGTARAGGASSVSEDIIRRFDEAAIRYTRHPQVSALFTTARGVLFELIAREGEIFIFYKPGDTATTHAIAAAALLTPALVASAMNAIQRSDNYQLPLLLMQQVNTYKAQLEAYELHAAFEAEGTSTSTLFKPPNYLSQIQSAQTRIEELYVRLAEQQKELTYFTRLQAGIGIRGYKGAQEILAIFQQNFFQPPHSLSPTKLLLHLRAPMFFTAPIADYLTGINNQRHHLYGKHDCIAWALRQVELGQLRIMLHGVITVELETSGDIDRINGTRDYDPTEHLPNPHINVLNCFTPAKNAAINAYLTGDYEAFMSQLIFAVASYNPNDGSANNRLMPKLNMDTPCSIRTPEGWEDSNLLDAYRRHINETAQTRPTEDGSEVTGEDPTDVPW